ncbi:MAG: methyltransferase [Proteobacteria bacterium]|nr:methyltransferase [Pseudomonadota bacterium]
MSILTQPCLLITLPIELAEEYSWLLVDLGAQSVEQRDDTTMVTVGNGRAELVAGFKDGASRNRAGAELERSPSENIEVKAVEIEDDGWSTRWREYYKPVVLKRLQIVTPWMKPPRPDRIPVVIDPGQAFGTGGHATTQLILEMLENSGDLPSEMLDIGTGSGVLAIAAVKLGAINVTAIDIDEESIAATRTNAAANQVEGNIEILEAAPGDLKETWSLVTANLDIGVFLNHSSAIADLIAPRGKVLLSGILYDQTGQCLDLWPNFELIESKEEDGWVALAIGRIP